MTAINNLKGHIVNDGEVVYSEELKPNLHFVVVQMYEPKYIKPNYGDSSKLWLEASITTGETHNWSNGVKSLIESKEIEKIKEGDSFRELRTLKTSQGFSVFEHAYGESYFEKDGVKMKSRRVKWLVEVPKQELAKFFQI